MVVQGNAERGKWWSPGGQLEGYYSNVTRHEKTLVKAVVEEIGMSSEDQHRERSSVFSAVMG